MTASNLIPLPTAKACRERQLLSRYDEIDRLKAELRAKEAAVIALQNEVARELGYYAGCSRENLERAIKGRKS
jgi:hypothetical protein